MKVVLVVAAVLWALPIGAWGACTQFLAGQPVGVVNSSLIDEASGMAASRKNPDVFWVHNDDGAAQLFAMNSAGELLGIYTLVGASNRDGEDIAIGPGPIAGEDYLYFGDIGDNAAVYSSVTVYRVLEPLVRPDQIFVTMPLDHVEAISLAYPGGARDAETLMVDPDNGDIYIVTKRLQPSQVYRAAYPQSTMGTTMMTLAATFEVDWPWFSFGLYGATAGDISVNGDLIILRGYRAAFLWARERGMTVADALAGPACAVPIVIEQQGEAVCFDMDGCGYFSTSEYVSQPIYYYEREERCPCGDINGDGQINLVDFAGLAGDWLTISQLLDLNGDGMVDQEDLAQLAGHWLWRKRWP